MFLTGKHLSRRTFIRGAGAAISLPFLEAMTPAGRLSAQLRAEADKTRLVCIEMVHGSAGAAPFGRENNFWSPAETGTDFDLSPSALSPLEEYRKWLTIISNTDVRMAEAFDADEIGGDHFRSSAVFLTQSHPKQTEGSDVRVGESLDQMFAKRFGQTTPIPSMQLCIENVDQSGGCAYGYACVYTDTVSWASETEPLPMIRDPRVVFDQLFGAGGTAEQREEIRRTNKSILDWVASEIADLQRALGPSDRQRVENYLDAIREIERRITMVEAYNESGEVRELPTAPAGVPDSFEAHVKLMFDLQALAFASDMTRVFSFKMGRDGSARIYPESGIDRPFHPASHHGNREENVRSFMEINRYHVSLLPYFLDRLNEIVEGEQTMLEKTAIIYGSPMGDPNVHNHKRCPLIFLGGGNGALDGGIHLRADDETPMANAMLSLMHGLGMNDIDSFGDSTGEFTFRNAAAQPF